ncbi:hypothetical protein SAMN05880590_11513 [Rhizobium sp. RU35A]|uniref:hypothetical protein n=1 Tax=Rhizobium sp. RU35A TaxID=1907414 RepID=UPI0009552A2E|nr:hypothetical protein [Rhizobium sp. RU35A]SIR24455.1 hypothetical protein SAMN05880590_11513 [Rhizobium sp. RU35A]
MTDSRNDSAEEILLAFAVEQAHDKATLDRYLQLYPHLSGELIDLSLDLRLQRATGEITTPADEAWVEASLAAFRATSPVQASTAVVDPFANVSSQELVSLRRALDVPSGVIQGFSSRLVDIASVPAWFVDALARGLQSTVDDLRRFMAAPPRLASSVSYKADDAPSADQKKITFEDLLKQCKVPDERRQQLLASRE